MSETVRVKVRVVASVMATAALLMSLPAVKLTSGRTAVLNSKPAGALRTRVTLESAAKSLFAPSVMVIAPSVVQAGEGALAAVSADRLLPPDAPLTVTAADALLAPDRANAHTHTNMKSILLPDFISRRPFAVFNETKEHPLGQRNLANPSPKLL